MARVLAGRGIAVLRYDNRSYLDSVLARKHGFTMHDQANDALDAFDALRNDLRFTHASIGLLGHSEGGASVAIAAAKNKDIAFAVMMSSQGIPGNELTYKQLTGTIDMIYKGNPLEKKIMYEGYKKTIEIIANHKNTDSMYSLLKENIKAYHEKYAGKFPKLFGKQPLESVYKHDSLFWLTPHHIAYVQFAPALYYPKIKCPVLIMFGKMDEKLQWKENMDGIKKIFRSVSKNNYQMIAIDSLNHSYQKASPTDSLYSNTILFHHNDKEKIKRDYSHKTFNMVADWITKQ